MTTTISPQKEKERIVEQFKGCKKCGIGSWSLCRWLQLGKGYSFAAGKRI